MIQKHAAKKKLGADITRSRFWAEDFGCFKRKFLAKSKNFVQHNPQRKRAFKKVEAV